MCEGMHRCACVPGACMQKTELAFKGRHCGGGALPGTCLPPELGESHFPHLDTPASAPHQACHEDGEVKGLLQGWGVG